MRAFGGVILGLIIGAALSFSVLAVAALASRSEQACTEPPAGWMVRADVDAAFLRAQLPAEPLYLGAGRIDITDASGSGCSRLSVRGRWHGPYGLRPADFAIELDLAVVEGGAAVRPATLWLGRLPLPLGWLPPQWSAPALQPVTEGLGQVLGPRPEASGLRLCHLASDAGGLSAYFCGP